MSDLFIRLQDADNVLIARSDVASGTRLGTTGIVARADIPQGHKIAARAIADGDAIYKYAQIIGFASQGIAPGDHVHSQNVTVKSFERGSECGVVVRPTDFVPGAQRATFQGFVRADGRVGSRNYIGILSTVNCSATVVNQIAAAFSRPDDMAAFPHVDGVVAFPHTTGCGIEAGGEGHRNLQRVMAGFARHPNFAGVLMVGLGCEVNQVAGVLADMGLTQSDTLCVMTIQDIGGTRQTVAEGIEQVRAMLPAANEARRQTVPAGHLTLALQCGGSDGYSGISANPALGAAADLLVRHGGTAILSETPEIYGAEHLLIARAQTRAVGEKLIERIKWWEDYTARTGGEMNNNPSPGNKAGGLTTILEKSLGSAAKGGTTNLVAVYKYAEPITEKGFVFMDSPGYDPASVTGQVASGANIVCFTTGRGSVFGFKPAPSLKLATNTALYERMTEDMDINCGRIIDGTATVSEMGREIFERILAVASGEQTKSEELGMGGNEFTPWQIGATM
ncbi:MAG: altronate dehydratase [Gammaproteobacteria bacterium]|nr:altronate dehydratase [Gammaproteobacteria bacterium]